VRNRRHLLSDYEGTREIWPAFTDVMSTMALIMFVLVLLAYVRNLIAEKRLQASREQIVLAERQLRGLGNELESRKAQLNAAQARMAEQQALVADSTRQLGNLRSQLSNIAVLRVTVLNKLKAAIEAQLGRADGTQVATIGDNGDIAVNESLVFEYNSYAIKKQARPVLDSLARALGNLLDDPDVRANIDTILIQGHTDERGSAAFNWELSAKRATAVLEYLFQSNKALADTYGNYFSAAAYSKFRPVNPEKSEAAYQQNRRIEIAVVPKDTQLRRVVDEYIQAPAPAPAVPPAPAAPPAR
jgi:chemotaxis protein MotB